MTKFYVAGRRDDIHAVNQMQMEVIAHGGEITYNWTDPLVRSIKEHWAFDDHKGADIAERERRGVEECDVLILVGKGDGLGSLIEVGMALALGDKKRLVLVDERVKRSVFWCLPDVLQYDFDEDSSNNIYKTLDDICSVNWSASQ